MKARLELHTQKFIDTLTAQDGKPIYKLSPKEARKVLDNLQAAYPVEKYPVQIEDLMIPCGPSGKVSIRIVRPTNSNGSLPVIMYFHGGGWILGNKETHDPLVRKLAVGAQAAVVFVNFSLSPEKKYPIPIEEAYAATKYVAEHGKALKLDSSRLAVAGDSVGGNMATVVALLAIERHGPKIDYQALFYPVTDANFNTESYRDFASGPWLTKAAMQWFWKAYAPRATDRKKPTASPLRASLEQLRRMPPTLLLTDENDVLRDEGEAYAHRLMQADIEVTVVRYLGTTHDFLLLNALSETPAVKSALALICSQLQKVLHRQKILKQKGAA